MTDLSKNIRGVTKQGNNISAVVLAVSGNRATVRLSTNGAIYKTLKVVGGPVYVNQKVQVDFSTDIPYIVAIGTLSSVADSSVANARKTFNYAKANAGNTYAILHFDAGGEVINSYSPDGAGLTNALEAAYEYSVIFLPSFYTNLQYVEGSNEWTLPAFVTLVGLSSQYTFIYGKINMSNGSLIENLRISNGNVADEDVSCVIGPEYGTAYIRNSFLESYATDRYAAPVYLAGGDIVVHNTVLVGSSNTLSKSAGFNVGGSGYNNSDIGDLYVYNSVISRYGDDASPDDLLEPVNFAIDTSGNEVQNYDIFTYNTQWEMVED